ncbi:hypothetical protein KM043_004865 [Ampulex compressa]|nr:hypothetical protein KM043_004865 [Ampulex compressa]
MASGCVYQKSEQGYSVAVSDFENTDPAPAHCASPTLSLRNFDWRRPPSTILRCVWRRKRGRRWKGGATEVERRACPPGWNQHASTVETMRLSFGVELRGGLVEKISRYS